MISGDQDSTDSIVLTDWVKDVNRSLLKKLENDLRDASNADPKNELLIRCMKEISILKSEMTWLETELKECTKHLDECIQMNEILKQKKQNSSKKK